MQVQRIFKISCKLSAGFGISTKTPAAKGKYSSNGCQCESERKGWGTNEWESPRGDKAALPEAHVNQRRSKDMMSVYRETGQASPGSSGSSILIIHRRKSGIQLLVTVLQLKVRRSKLAQQPSQLDKTAWLLTGGGIYRFLEMGENESSVSTPSQRGKHVQLVKCCALWRFGALLVSACGSLFCCRLLQRELRVHTRGRVFARACVFGKGGNPHPSSLQYII